MKPRIIIAEDIPMLMNMLNFKVKRLIDLEKVEIIKAKDGREVVACYLDALKNNVPVILILMDIFMTKDDNKATTDGNLATADIRKIEEEQKLAKTPIYCISDSKETYDTDTICQTQMNGYLGKFFGVHTLPDLLPTFVLSDTGKQFKSSRGWATASTTVSLFRVKNDIPISKEQIISFSETIANFMGK